MRAFSKLQRLAGLRSYSVVAWGRNTSGECGVRDWQPVVLSPRPVAGLEGAAVAALAAGKAHSAAVTAAGEALTWGSGEDGKLGHGCTDGAHLPHRVEALAERVHVAGVALGRHHSLFRDAGGAAWGCGSSREGQLGLGAPAGAGGPGAAHAWAAPPGEQQQQQQWEGGAAPAAPAAPGGGSLPGASSGQGWAAAAAAAPAVREAVEWPAHHAWGAAHLRPFVDHAQRTAELGQALALFSDELRDLAGRESAWRRYEAARAAAAASLVPPGLAPGQHATPARVGGGRHALLGAALPEELCLASERVLQVAACRQGSMALTARGEVWTWGAAPAAGGTPPDVPRPVGGRLGALLTEHGGATSVAAGGSFCAALCASGAVVVWGGAAGAPAAAAPPPPPEVLELPHLRAFYEGGLLVAQFTGLPPMALLAAGAGHVAMSDGERVWGVGRSAGACAPPPGAAAPPPPAGEDLAALTPRELLRLPGGRVAVLRAGGFASAAVTDDGGLWLWGSVLAPEAAAGLLGAAPEGAAAWAGLGAERPTLVPGLAGVRDAALGSCHALALLDG
eukprot:scaffold17.g440.t1